MKNLEQIRAANAISYANSPGAFGGQNGGEVVKKLPAMIMTNGLLAAAAFAADKKKGWEGCFNHMAKHLGHSDIGILGSNTQNINALLKELSEKDSATLKLATAEALAWLSYAKRFVKNTGGSNDSDDE